MTSLWQDINTVLRGSEANPLERQVINARLIKNHHADRSQPKILAESVLVGFFWGLFQCWGNSRIPNNGKSLRILVIQNSKKIKTARGVFRENFFLFIGRNCGLNVNRRRFGSSWVIMVVFVQIFVCGIGKTWLEGNGKGMIARLPLI